MNSEHNFSCTKTQVISKIKYLKGQYTQAKNKDRSGASRDDLIRCCPYFDELKPILDHGKYYILYFPKLHNHKSSIKSCQMYAKDVYHVKAYRIFELYGALIELVSMRELKKTLCKIW